ncbi:hypothetical protein [Adlercreutzia sp. ZJ138]|uniref:hypothetical protein n=1 Tax=Adlercreutzia sp. ZJ138 TaxID=2709405 RepID=UPI0013ED13EC|nr:hypothetical protein [Adlercreutzia sp. ZJ138]
MTIGITDSQHYQDIADAIREKTGGTAQMSPGEMAAEIAGIETGGGENYLAEYARGTLTELNETNCGALTSLSPALSGGNITSINLPNVETVDTDALTTFKSVKHVNLPKLKRIGNTALLSHAPIESLTLPSLNETGYNDTLVSDCLNLKYLSLPAITVLESAKISGGPLLYNCPGLKNLYLENLERVGDGTATATTGTERGYFTFTGGYKFGLEIACFPKLMYQTGGQMMVVDNFKTACYPELVKQVRARHYASCPLVYYYNAGTTTTKDCCIYIPKCESFAANFTNNANCLSLTIVIGNENSTGACALEGGVYISGSYTPDSLQIFVPDHLLEEYKNATNWVLHAEYIKPQSEMTDELWQRINDAMVPPQPPEEAA